MSLQSLIDHHVGARADGGSTFLRRLRAAGRLVLAIIVFGALCGAMTGCFDKSGDEEEGETASSSGSSSGGSSSWHSTGSLDLTVLSSWTNVPIHDAAVSADFLDEWGDVLASGSGRSDASGQVTITVTIWNDYADEIEFTVEHTDFNTISTSRTAYQSDATATVYLSPRNR
ncbi:MAG: hypothetical protein JXP34_28145 [Planctomycetes bacterium]|nr:hypothetical protein [Planctomycetota bacterium]